MTGMSIFQEIEWLRAFVIALMLVAVFAVALASLALLDLRAIRRWIEDHPDFAFAPRNMRPLTVQNSSIEHLRAAWNKFKDLPALASPPFQPPPREP